MKIRPREPERLRNLASDLADGAPLEAPRRPGAVSGEEHHLDGAEESVHALGTGDAG